jgi:nucleotide-binding universal stress UspA family protein
MKLILAATDFSARSDRAIRRAALLARAHDARLMLLHVVDDDRPERLVAEEMATAQELLQKTAESVLSDVQSEAKVVLGDPFEGVAKTARESAADLIVMGAHRKQILRGIFIGTSVERVMRMRIAPVLMVNAEPLSAYERGLVATDLSEHSGHALQVARQLRILPPARVVVVRAFDVFARGKLSYAGVSTEKISSHVKEMAAEARSELAGFIAALDADFKPEALRVKEGRAAGVIVDTADETGADIVVVGTHGRSGIAKFLLGSVTEEVMWRLERDILVVPPRPKDA